MTYLAVVAITGAVFFLVVSFLGRRKAKRSELALLRELENSARVHRAAVWAESGEAVTGKALDETLAALDELRKGGK